MSTGRDDLYRLIQSMSKSEKRYFKMEAKKAGDKTSNHIKLFDALNEMEEYDEGKLKKKLSKEKFIEHLPAEKRYLSQNIYKSLRNFRSEKSIYAQIKSMLLDSSYLIERGLYDIAERKLDKVEKLAHRVEDQLSILEINVKKRELVRTIRNKTFHRETEKLVKEKDKIFSRLSAELDVLDLYEKMGIILDQQLVLKDQKSIDELKKEVAILDKFNHSDSAFLQYRRTQIKAFYFSLSGELDQATKFLEEVIEWWDVHPTIKKELYYLYQLDLNNLISHYFSSGQEEKVLDVLTKLESEEPKSVHEQSIIFQKVSINRLVYYMGNAEFEQAKLMIPGIVEGLKKYKVTNTSRIVLFTNISILYFVLQRHKDSLAWLGKIINDNKTSHRLDLQRLARLLYIVNQIETDTDYQIIDNFCRATHRFLKNSGLTEKQNSEYVILSFLRKYLSLPESEQKTVLKAFKNELEHIKNNPREAVSPGLDEFHYWIRSKLEKRSIIQLIEANN